MPSVPIHPPAQGRAAATSNSALPNILRTPAGLALVEIQGTVRSSSTSTQDASPIGKLVFPHYDSSKGSDDTSWQKRVHLYVGKHQRLTGEVKKLSKPVALLRRRPTADDSDELEIAEIIYHKLLFAHRPEPVGGGGAEE